MDHAHFMMLEVGDVTRSGVLRLLGLSRYRSAVRVAQEIESGLPFTAFKQVQALAGLSQQQLGEAIGMSSATLQRRRSLGRLSSTDSDHLYRLADLVVRANEAFDDDAEAAQAFLSSPCAALNGRVPLKLATTEAGASLVRAVLGAIDRGSYL